MKTAIIFADGLKQIVLTPENKEEEFALSLITTNDDISLATTSGTIYDSHSPKPFHGNIQGCRGGYLRVFSDSNSIMLVLKPKENEPKNN